MAQRIQHSGESVRVLDLVVTDERMNTWLDGHEFIDCEVVGPAVLLMATQDVSFDGNSMNASQFWEIDPRRPYSGGIGLRNCRFHGCSFRDIGIAADRATLRAFGV